jgi:hypothetical protein
MLSSFFFNVIIVTKFGFIMYLTYKNGNKIVRFHLCISIVTIDILRCLFDVPDRDRTDIYSKRFLSSFLPCD